MVGIGWVLLVITCQYIQIHQILCLLLLLNRACITIRLRHDFDKARNLLAAPYSIYEAAHASCLVQQLFISWYRGIDVSMYRDHRQLSQPGDSIHILHAWISLKGTFGIVSYDLAPYLKAQTSVFMVMHWRDKSECSEMCGSFHREHRIISISQMFSGITFRAWERMP